VHQLKQEDAECPRVNLVIVGQLFNHLRSHVLECAAVRCTHVVRHVNRVIRVSACFCARAEVTHLECIVLGQQHVLGLDVTVDQPILVKEVDALDSLDEVVEHFIFG
jgi:hypothetical protein